MVVDMHFKQGIVLHLEDQDVLRLQLVFNYKQMPAFVEDHLTVHVLNVDKPGAPHSGLQRDTPWKQALELLLELFGDDQHV